ncbi:hypothetical protein AB0M02_22150 [Actinoplanes sp. NPDC051861]|uniref:hypothetical protein n=1 Tax=Actinoplanes sp. NPDC051861 TaxID=3155170 RepID=UPI00341309B4
MAGRRWVLGFVVCAALLGGCGNETIVDGEPVDDGAQRQNDQAREALARYEEAIRKAGGAPRYVPIGELTGQRGDWEAAVGDDFKRALGAGQVVTSSELPRAPRRTGEVSWGSEELSLPLLSATEALDELAMTSHHENCPDCRPLDATGARFTTVTVQTTRGQARVPAWEYTLKGTKVRITRPAVGSVSVKLTPPSWDPYNTPAGLAIDSAVTKVGSRTLTVGFTGAPKGAADPCGADYEASAVESEHAVVIVVETRLNAAEQACPDIGFRRTAPVELAEPLGERAVLEVMQGLPVPVTIN